MSDSETLSTSDGADKSELYELHEKLVFKDDPHEADSPASINLKKQDLKTMFDIFARQTNGKVLNKAYDLIYNIILNARTREISHAAIIELGEFGKNIGSSQKKLMAVDLLGMTLEHPQEAEEDGMHGEAIESILKIANSTTLGNEKEGAVVKEAMRDLDEFIKTCSTHKDYTSQTKTINRARDVWKLIAPKAYQVKGFDSLPIQHPPRNATPLRK